MNSDLVEKKCDQIMLQEQKVKNLGTKGTGHAPQSETKSEKKRLANSRGDPKSELEQETCC